MRLRLQQQQEKEAKALLLVACWVAVTSFRPLPGWSIKHIENETVSLHQTEFFTLSPSEFLSAGLCRCKEIRAEARTFCCVLWVRVLPPVPPLAAKERPFLKSAAFTHRAVCTGEQGVYMVRYGV